jgi:hypothetical protein
VPRNGYRVGVPKEGEWEAIFSTELKKYGGSSETLQQPVKANAIPWQGRPHSVVLNLPGLSTTYFLFRPKSSPAEPSVGSAVVGSAASQATSEV